MTIEEEVAGLLQQKRLTIATAESCTGGLVAARLVSVPGVSEVFMEGLVTYSNQAKMRLLGVKEATLASFGAVSRETAVEMAEGGRRQAKTDVCVSTTGIAGPDGGTEEKPVGLVYMACCVNGRTAVKRCQFSGDRQQIRGQAAETALALVRSCLWPSRRRLQKRTREEGRTEMERARVKKQLGAACSYAYSRLTLNYYMYYDASQEEDFPEKILGPLAERFHSLLGGFLQGSTSLEELDALRSEVIREMEQTTAYTDILQAYEYVLNRLEGRFEPRLMGKARPAVDAEETAWEIMAHIREAGDAASINQRIQNIVGQLPVRLTKAKFFAMVEEGLSLYIGSPRESLDDMIGLLRS